MKHAFCPHCKEMLDVEKVLDTEHCGDEVVLIVEGTCPICEKAYQWEEVFDFLLARNVEKRG